MTSAVAGGDAESPQIPLRIRLIALTNYALSMIWKLISNTAFIIVAGGILMVLGIIYASAANNTTAWFGWKWWLATFGMTLTVVLLLDCLRGCKLHARISAQIDAQSTYGDRLAAMHQTKEYTKRVEGSLGRFDVLRHANAAALFVVLSLLIVQYALTVFSYNWTAYKTDVAMVVDGKPITDSTVRWAMPFAHDIQLVERKASTDWHTCESTTADGLRISAKLALKLRRSDNPENWQHKDRATPSRDESMQARFDQVCRNAKAENLYRQLDMLKLLLAGDGMKPHLSKAFQLDGEIEVKDIYIYGYEKE